MPKVLEDCVESLTKKWSNDPKSAPALRKGQDRRAQAFAMCTSSLKKKGLLEMNEIIKLEGVGPAILGAALTNRPHIKGLPPVTIEEREGKKLMRIPLLRMGKWKHPTGLLVFDDQAVDRMIKNFQDGTVGNHVSVDMRHQPELGAQGWFTEFKREEQDGKKLLVGYAEPTPVGERAVSDKIYQYASLEFHPNWESPLVTAFSTDDAALTELEEPCCGVVEEVSMEELEQDVEETQDQVEDELEDEQEVEDGDETEDENELDDLLDLAVSAIVDDEEDLTDEETDTLRDVMREAVLDAELAMESYDASIQLARSLKNKSSFVERVKEKVKKGIAWVKSKFAKKGKKSAGKMGSSSTAVGGKKGTKSSATGARRTPGAATGVKKNRQTRSKFSQGSKGRGKMESDDQLVRLEERLAELESKNAELVSQAADQFVQRVMLEAKNYRDSKKNAHPKVMLEWFEAVLRCEQVGSGDEVIELEEADADDIGAVHAYYRQAAHWLVRNLPGSVPMKTPETVRDEKRPISGEPTKLSEDRAVMAEIDEMWKRVP